MQKEKINVYFPKTLNEAKKLFSKFEQMNLEKLDRDKFFNLFLKGNGNIGFAILNNTWKLIDPRCDDLFDITIINIDEALDENNQATNNTKGGNIEKWRKICIDAENVASEVLNSEEAKAELTINEARELLKYFGDDEYVIINDDYEFIVR